MQNQHEKISGYRGLGQEEIDLINEAKALGGSIDAFIKKLDSFDRKRAEPGYKDSPVVYPFIDGRWLAIAKTELQKGIMFLVRSIARPEGF